MSGWSLKLQSARPIISGTRKVGKTLTVNDAGP
jgi:hypothetical protein